RDDVHGERPLAELFRVLPVDVALELAHQVRRNAALASLVAVVEGTAVGNQHPYQTPVEHLVEIPFPGLHLRAQLARLCCRVGWLRACSGNDEECSRE